MKNINILNLFIFSFLMFTACNPLKKMIELSKQQQINVNPDPITLAGSSVSFDVQTTLPKGMLPKGTSYTLNFEFDGNDVGSVEFKASDYPNSSSSTSTSTQTISVPYNSATMGGSPAKLTVVGTAKVVATGNSLDTDESDVADGVNKTITLTNASMIPTPKAYPGYTDAEETETTSVDFYFNQGSSYLRGSERKSDRGEKFSAFLAEKNKVNLEFEASVAGGIPILRTIKEGLATNKLTKVYGILNGTCNYILSEMEKTKKSFPEVLKKAQSLGYAEPGNPKLDLNGYDAFAKIRILSSLAFNKKISKKNCIMEGIENIEYKDIEITSQLNFRIKLLGITEIIGGKLFERVHPALVKKDTYIGNVNGVMNAVIVEGQPVGESVLQGEGAGPGATSSALMSDLLSILRGNIKYPFGLPDFKRLKPVCYNEKKSSNSLYIRLEVIDKPGVLSQITKLLANNKISIERVLQTPDHKKKSASIVIITHKAFEYRSLNLINSLKKNKNVIKKPVLIRLF